MPRIISPTDKLIRRIQREFSRKKLIGDILVSDEEFELLVDYLRKTYSYMVDSKKHSLNDPVFCVALVQIGIRYYDGSFWPHVKNLLQHPKFNVNYQTRIGVSFINTMHMHGKLFLGSSERANSILMHGFVSNGYADKFFSFLFAFYKIDLERNIERFDTNAMNDLIDIMKRNDNTGRTYWIVEHTADAVRQNTRGCKTRIRRCLKLIDKAFWDETIPENSANRLTQSLIRWKDSSDDFNIERRRYNGGGIITKGKKSFSSPYIKYDYKKTLFSLILPPQIIRFNDFENLYWSISINGSVKLIDINPYTQGVTGYKTEEEIIGLPCEDIFRLITVELMNGSNRLRPFRIPEEAIRFFDLDGDFIKADCLTPGDACSFTPSDFTPVSEAVIESERIGNLIFTNYCFENGDIIRLPDGKPLSVGRKLQEGLLPRGTVVGAIAQWDDEICPVYSSPPSVLAKLLPRRSFGTAIKVNDFAFRMYDAQTLIVKAITINLYDRSGESGYLFSLKDLGCNQDGLYEVYIDVPNDRTNRVWRFALINGLSYHFEDSPYIFKTRGTICLPEHLDFRPLSDNMQKELSGVESHYNFDINAGEPHLFFQHRDIAVGFALPVLSYKFGNEDWQTGQHVDIWHAEFSPKLLIRYHTDKLKISLDDSNCEDDAEEEHVEVFTKIKSRNVFECDLNRFKSWFGKNAIRRQLHVELPDIAGPVPLLGVITKSVLVSGILRGDFDKGLLVGEFDITGYASYYMDLFFNGNCIAEKAPLINGMFAAFSDLKSGNYEAHIYEAEEDDSGFGDIGYFEIGKKSLDLLNPQNLVGKSILIRMIKPSEQTTSYLKLNNTYTVENLKPINDLDKNNYSGRMVVENTWGEVLATFPVNVDFFDLQNLKFVYITFYDDEETLEFLYDEYKKIIVKQEDPNLSRTQAYRRYKQSLFPKDYVFEIEFINSAKRIATPEVDDRAYNNLLPPHYRDAENTQPQLSKTVFSQRQSSTQPRKNISIKDLNLSVKTFNCLNRAGITDTDAICKKGRDGLRKVRNLGNRSLKEISSKLWHYGITLY